MKSVILLCLAIALPALGMAQASAADTSAKALVLFRAQKWQEAEPLYVDLLKNGPTEGHTGFEYRLGVVRFNLKNYPSAIELLEDVRSHQFALPQTLPFLVMSYALSGNQDLALDRLDEAIAVGYGDLRSLERAPEFESIRETPRFKAALEKMEFPLKGVPGADGMDFWVGDWVVSVTGANLFNNTSHIVKQLRGFSISENWTDSTGREGKSFFYFDRFAHEWRQSWIDDTGWIVEKIGKPEKDGIKLAGTSYVNGQPVMAKEELLRINENQVRQVLHNSTDGGKTWKLTTDLTYIRRGTKG